MFGMYQILLKTKREQESYTQEKRQTDEILQIKKGRNSKLGSFEEDKN